MENANYLKPELSKTNDWWIPKDRYYELKHFCLMYPTYNRVRKDILANSIQSTYILTAIKGRKRSYTEEELIEAVADICARCSRRMDMVNKAASNADVYLADVIIKGVTENLSYDVLKLKYNIPCSRGVYYDLYRKFFWYLDKIRD